ASDGNMYIPTGKKGTIERIIQNGALVSLTVENGLESAQITKKSCPTDKYVIINTDKGIAIQTGIFTKKWISSADKDIIARDSPTPEGCEMFALDDKGDFFNILYSKNEKKHEIYSYKLKSAPASFTFKKIFWNKDRTKILATDGAKNLCLLFVELGDTENNWLEIEAYAFDVPVDNVVDIVEDEKGNIFVLGNKIELDDKGVTTSESPELHIAVLEQTSGDKTILKRKNADDKVCDSLKVKQLIPLKNSPVSKPEGMAIREGNLLIAGYGKKDKEPCVWETPLDSLLAQGKKGITSEEVDSVLEQLFEKFIADTKEETLSKEPIAVSQRTKFEKKLRDMGLFLGKEVLPMDEKQAEIIKNYFKKIDCEGTFKNKIMNLSSYYLYLYRSERAISKRETLLESAYKQAYASNKDSKGVIDFLNIINAVIQTSEFDLLFSDQGLKEEG
ncbi:MAG: hypothetical protein KAJ14_12515, partial [Candidatus Omnitrophica bacterium]|nr:hypothetical protein [Candidatus Omnitrophota bacterium]